MNSKQPDERTVPIKFIWEMYLRLWAEGQKLRAEGDKLWAKGAKLRVEGNKLWAEGIKHRVESYKLRAEGDRLRAEGSRLWADGNRIWAEGVLASYGNVTIEWRTPTHCIVDGKDEYTESGGLS